MAEKTLAIIGFGQFGQFMVPHLRDHFDLRVTNRSDKSAVARALNLPYVTFEEAAEAEVVVLCMPVQNMEATLERIAPRLRDDVLLLDVASVKIGPVELMRAHAPAAAEIVSLHPMFGPQSGRHGIADLKCVLCDVRTRPAHYQTLRAFLAGTLKLHVLEMTPARHDEEIAYIQGLTHWISRAVRMMHLPDVSMSTPAYEHFLQIGEILRDDSLALFRTIERENPYADEVRRQFMAKLAELEEQIRGD